MVPLPIWLTNVQFVIGAFGAFAFFAAAWLNLDSWAVRKEFKTGLRSLGFLMLAVWSALHGIGSVAAIATVISSIALAAGALCIAVSYVLDVAPPTPKEMGLRGKEQEEKIEQVLRGPKTKPTATSPPAETKEVKGVKPSPPALGAPLTTPAMLPQPRPAKTAAAPLAATRSRSTTTDPKTGLRTEALVKLPKLARRRRARLLVSLLILTVIIALAAGSAYLIVTRTNFFKPAPEPSPFLIETQEPTPTALTDPSPSPTPSAEPEVTVTIDDTETGFLNVREEASTTSASITRVTPGEEYPLIEENEAGDWYKIQLDEDTTGWIAARYATKN